MVVERGAVCNTDDRMLMKLKIGKKFCRLGTKDKLMNRLLCR